MTDISFCRQQINMEPDVKAYRILIRAPILKEKTAAGVILPSESKVGEGDFNIGLILKLGPLAFKGKDAQSNVWDAYKADVGTWVWYSKYEREPLYHPSINCYLISDDRILAAVDPQDIEFILNKVRGGHFE